MSESLTKISVRQSQSGARENRRLSGPPVHQMVNTLVFCVRGSGLETG